MKFRIRDAWHRTRRWWKCGTPYSAPWPTVSEIMQNALKDRRLQISQNAIQLNALLDRLIRVELDMVTAGLLCQYAEDHLP